MSDCYVTLEVMSVSVFISLIILHLFMPKDCIFWNVRMLGSLKIVSFSTCGKCSTLEEVIIFQERRHSLYFNDMPRGFWTQYALGNESQGPRGLAFNFN